MGIAQGLILYAMIYWLAIFIVLPFGIKTPETVEEGHATGAPSHPNMKRKFIITAIVTAVIWLGIFLAIKFDVIDFYAIAQQMTDEDHIK